jgi:nitrate/nitrite transport system ATP-binding protein
MTTTTVLTAPDYADILHEESFEDRIKLSCRKLAKEYPTPKGMYVVLDDFDLDVYRGEFISIIGHSGCGKSTVLSMMAGLNPISRGTIQVGRQPVSGPGPDRAVVFQSPSLFPWMTALGNVMLGVNRVYPHARKKEREAIGKYYLDKVGLSDAFDKKAAEMSNGMKQRVGIARAFALKPEVLLLDEPFGMLDSLTRAELQEVLMEVWGKEQITAVMVTHDVDEAIYLSDRIIMMTSGPHARVGDTLRINLPRPRIKSEAIEHPDYYHYREHLIRFLEG